MMNEVGTKLYNDLMAIKDFRGKVAVFWKFLEQFPPMEMPLVHRYQEGVYIREIFMAAGTIVIGKIHKHEHWNFILKGSGVFITKEGKFIYNGPQTFISGPGIQKIVFNVTDTVWSTIHHNPTNTQDLTEIEKEVVIPSYMELDEFLGIQEALL